MGLPSELRSSLCARRLERTVLRPVLLLAKTAQFNQFFRQVRRRIVKSSSLTESLQRALPYILSQEVCDKRSCPTRHEHYL